MEEWLFFLLVLIPLASFAALVLASRNDRRLRDVEEELRRLRLWIASPERASAAAPPERAVPPQAPAPEKASTEESPSRPLPPPPLASPLPVPASGPVSWRTASGTLPVSVRPREDAVGRTLLWLRDQWLLVAGALALQLGIAFGVKYAFTQDWFGPGARVGASAGAGVLLIALAWWPRVARVRLLSEALLAVGFVALYYSAFAAHGFYDLVSLTTALSVACGVALVSGVLAGLRNLPFLGHLALFGAYLAPILFRSGEDRQVALFLYVFVVTAGGLVLVAWRAWPTLSPFLAVSVLGLETLWAARFHDSSVLVRSLLLHGLLWLELLALPWIRRTRTPAVLAADLGVVVLVAGSAAFQIALHCEDPGRQRLAGHLTLGIALVYGLLSVRRPYLFEPALCRAHLAVAAVLVPVAFAHWFDGTPVTWILAGECLWLAWLAFSRTSPFASLGSLAAGAVAGLRVLLEVDRTGNTLREHVWITASGMLTAGFLYAALSLLGRRKHEDPASPSVFSTIDSLARSAARNLGEFLAAAVLVVPVWRLLDELRRHFRWSPPVFLGSMALFLAGTSLALLAGGIAARHVPRRVVARLLALGALLALALLAGSLASGARDLGPPFLHLPLLLGVLTLTLTALELRKGGQPRELPESGLRGLVAAGTWLGPLALLCAEWLRVVRWYGFSDRSGQAGISMFLAGYAVLWLVVALRRRSRTLRWASLGLFAVLVVKMALVDLPALETVWRIVAFLVVGVLLVCGWLVLRRFDAVDRQAAP